MSNLTLQQKVNNYVHKHKPNKNKQDTSQSKQPQQDFNEIKTSIPEDVRNMVESYRQQHPMFAENEIYSILKRFDYNKKVADDYINVIKERAKDINSGEWIEVSQKPKQKVAKEAGEKGKDAEKKEGKKKNYQPSRRDRDDFHETGYNRSYRDKYNANEEYYGANDYNYRKNKNFSGTSGRYYRNFRKNYDENDEYEVIYLPKNAEPEYELAYVPKESSEKPIKSHNEPAKESREEKTTTRSKERQHEEKKSKEYDLYEPKETKYKHYDSKPKKNSKPYQPAPWNRGKSNYDYKGRRKFYDEVEIEYVPKSPVPVKPEEKQPEKQEKSKNESPKKKVPQVPEIPKETPKKIEEKPQIPINMTPQTLQEKISESLDLKKPENKKTEEIPVNKIKETPPSVNPTPVENSFPIRGHSENPQPNNQPVYSQFLPKNNFGGPVNTSSNSPPIQPGNNPIVNPLNKPPTTLPNIQPPNIQQPLPPNIQQPLPPNIQQPLPPNIQQPLPQNNQQAAFSAMNPFNLPILYLMMPNGQQCPVLLTPLQVPPQGPPNLPVNEASANTSSFGYPNGMGKDNVLTLNPMNTPQFPFALNFNPMSTMNPMGGPPDMNMKNEASLQPKDNTQPNNFYLSNPNNFFQPYNQNANMYYPNK